MEAVLRAHRPAPWFGLLLSFGCAQPGGPVFEELERPIRWPPEPAPARIRYVGQLTRAADLKPPTGFLEEIGDFLAGEPEPQRLYGPRAVVCTPDGSAVWIADPGGRCLHRFDLQDRGYLRVEKFGESLVLSPVGLCLGPADSIYVCDSEEIAIHRLSAADGSLIESLPLPEDLRRPVALAYDPDEDQLYVADVESHDIKVLGRDGTVRARIGRRGSEAGEFNYPCDLIDDGQLLWVVDSGNHRVQGLTHQGEPILSIGSEGDSPGNLALPKSAAVDSDGHLYVVDARFENIQIFDRAGRLLLFFGEEGTGPGEFWLPGGLFIDRNDRIWLCDTYNNRIQVFDYLREVADEADR